MKNLYNDKILVALGSGKMMTQSYELFAKSGLRSRSFEESFNSKNYEYEGENVTFTITKDFDIPQAVDGGDEDFGICGLDNVMEYELSNVTPTGAVAGRGFISGLVDDLGICKMSFNIAGFKEKQEEFYKLLQSGSKTIVIATAYPAITRNYFLKNFPNARIDIRTLAGKVESAPKRYGDSAIFEIVSSGGALAANGLVSYQKAFDIPTKLLISKTAARKDPRIGEITDKIKTIVEKEKTL